MYFEKVHISGIREVVFNGKEVWRRYSNNWHKVTNYDARKTAVQMEKTMKLLASSDKFYCWVSGETFNAKRKD